MTRAAMQEAISPEAKEIDLAEYEGNALMVRGYDSGGWIYSAQIVEQGGPILSAVVHRVFDEGSSER